MPFLYILLAILLFGVLILVHEAGHYLTARLCGVTVNEFSVGMGPKLISHTSKKTGIAYSLRLLPIGGFVSMAGEDEDSDDPNAFNNKTIPQRLLILIAGAFMNLLIGLILMVIISVGTNVIGSTTIERFEDSASSQASGLMPGDEILKVGDQRVWFSSDLCYTLMHDCVEPIDVLVQRGDEKVLIKNVVFPTYTVSGVVFGDYDFRVHQVKRTPSVVFHYAVNQCGLSVRMVCESLVDLITGRYGVEAMSGPVGVIREVSETAKTGTINLLYLCAVISVNLGIFNLLPLPALDGGRVLFVLIEAVFRRPVNRTVESYIHFAGLILLMLLMALVTYQDIAKLIVR